MYLRINLPVLFSTTTNVIKPQLAMGEEFTWKTSLMLKLCKNLKCNPLYNNKLIFLVIMVIILYLFAFTRFSLQTMVINIS